MNTSNTSGHEVREKKALELVHVLGVLAAFIGAGVLLAATMTTGNVQVIAAAAVFSGGLLVSFLISAARTIIDRYARMPAMKRAERAAIYILVAGAYTPFAWIVVGGQTGFAILAFVWVAAVIGVVLSVAPPKRFGKAPIVLFVMITWALVGAADSLLTNMSKHGIYMMIFSGWLLSVGYLFVRWDILPFQDAIWRLFVLLSTASLYAAIFVELTSL